MAAATSLTFGATEGELVLNGRPADRKFFGEAGLFLQQEIERRELEVALKQNATWTGSLQAVHQYGWDPRRIAKRRERIDLLTPGNLKDTFLTYYPPDRYTVLTLLPEAGAESGAKAGGEAKGKPGSD